MFQKTNSYQLQQTFFAKGIAILLLMFHHLFFLEPKIGLIYGNINITQNFAQLAKLCVSMFIIISGFGLTESIKGGAGVKQFFAKRFGNIYLNYWLVWLIFVPICIILNYLDLSDYYKDNIFKELIINILGLHVLFNTGSVQGSWWFITLILVLYLFFPLFRILIIKFGIACVFGSLFFKYIPFITIPDHLNLIISNIFPFVFGIYLSHINFFDQLHLKKTAQKIWLYGFNALLFIILTLLKIKFQIACNGLIFDVAAFWVILICFDVYPLFPNLNKSIVLYGKYSFTIYLFHGFVQVYFVCEIMHKFHSASIVYLIMIGLCIIIAYLIEKIKEITAFNRLLLNLKKTDFKDTLFIQ